MAKNNQTIFRGDSITWIILAVLVSISILEVFSSTFQIVHGARYHGNWINVIMQHVQYCAIGVFGAFFITLVDIRRAWRLSYLAWGIAFLLVMAAKLKGTAENGASRWIFGIQPSELLKITTILVMASISQFYKKEDNDNTPEEGCRFTNNFKKFAFASAFILPSFLVIFMENVSTAILLLFTCCITCLIAGMKIKWFVCTLVPLSLFGFILILFAGTDFYKDHMRGMFGMNRLETVHNRMMRFLEPVDTKTFTDDQIVTRELKDQKKYQQTVGKIAIAQSSWHGTGIGNSKFRSKLPHAYDDFIYATTVEEGGLILPFIINMAYIILLIRIGKIITACETKFCATMIAGLGIMMAMQALINMSVSLGIGPVTGQPLPLISRGGTSMAIYCFVIGLILNVSHYDAHIKEKQVANQDREEQQ